MTFVNTINKIKSFYTNELKTDCRILGLHKTDGGYTATCEVLVDPEFTRKKGIGDMVEIYEVLVNETGDITGYEKKATKMRATVESVD
ncbi:MAG: hypothetical protein PHG19_11600 [Anaerotignum sp.]|nr:hypothetical protein [Anaerotignum sp.]